MSRKLAHTFSRFSQPLKWTLAMLCIGPVVGVYYQGCCLNEPLWEAAYRGDLPRVKSLLAMGANPNIRGDDGMNSLGTAKRHGYTKVVDVLRKAGAMEEDQR